MASEKQRYELAKTVVAKRAVGQKGRSSGGVGPVEETVVLRIGGGKGSGVEVMRSFTRRKRLWRAQPNGNEMHSRNGTSGSR